MFRAVLCSSSGGQIVLLQHLVLLPSVNGRTVRRLRAIYIYIYIYIYIISEGRVIRFIVIMTQRIESTQN